MESVMCGKQPSPSEGNYDVYSEAAPICRAVDYLVSGKVLSRKSVNQN